MYWAFDYIFFWLFWFTFIVNLWRQFFCNFRKKVLNWNVYKHVSDQFVGILEFYLSTFCVLAPAFVEAQNIHQKARCIIVVDPKRAGFLISNTVFCYGIETLPYVWKTRSQKWAAFVFGSSYCYQTFTECVSSQCTHFYKFTYQMWQEVMERPLIWLRFLGILIRFWQPFMSQVLYLHQTFTDCVSNQYINFDLSTCQMWLQVMEGFVV